MLHRLPRLIFQDDGDLGHGRGDRRRGEPGEEYGSGQKGPKKAIPITHSLIIGRPPPWVVVEWICSTCQSQPCGGATDSTGLNRGGEACRVPSSRKTIGN